MKKVLLGFIMDGKSGGVDMYIKSVINTLSPDFKIDVLTNSIDKNLKAEFDIKNVGLYEVDRLTHPYKQFRQIVKLIKENNYEITYVNVSTAVNFSFSLAAWKSKVPIRIVHSHSSGIDGKSGWKKMIFRVMHQIGKTILLKTSNRFWACSEMAGKWMFNSRTIETSEFFKIIPNTIEFEKFQYDSKVRVQVRKDYNFTDKIVLGHISNFQPVKNVEFLIKVFHEAVKEIENVALLLVGSSSKHDMIREEINKYGLQDKVVILDFQNDISQYYQAMDFFLLPSLFEGLPLVGVEAQVSGVCSLFSDRITKEVQITEKCEFLSIEDGVLPWVNCIKTNLNYKRDENKRLENAALFDRKNQREKLMINMK